jgi:hypothetical protein
MFAYFRYNILILVTILMSLFFRKLLKFFRGCRKKTLNAVKKLDRNNKCYGITCLFV